MYQDSNERFFSLALIAIALVVGAWMLLRGAAIDDIVLNPELYGITYQDLTPR